MSIVILCVIILAIGFIKEAISQKTLIMELHEIISRIIQTLWNQDVEREKFVINSVKNMKSVQARKQIGREYFLR